MKIEHLNNNFVRLTPDTGKILYNSASEQFYSEAIIKENKISQFKEELEA